jgi:hypothetical protein
MAVAYSLDNMKEELLSYRATMFASIALKPVTNQVAARFGDRLPHHWARAAGISA